MRGEEKEGEVEGGHPRGGGAEARSKPEGKEKGREKEREREDG